MLGRVLFVLYVAAVLLISGFAKADSLPQMIPTPKVAELNSQVVSFNESNYLVRMTGTVNNGCAIAPYPVLRPTQDGSTYVLTVVTKFNDKIMCPQVANRKYDLAFDLRSLFYKWTPAKIKSVRMIVSVDKKFVLPIDGEGMISAFPFAETQARGLLVPLNEKNWGVVTAKDTVIALKAIDVNFEDYKNKIVVVTGHAFPAELPIVDVTSADSDATAGTSPSKVLAVSGISVN